MARPLVLTADVELLDEVLRLAVAAGVEVDVAPDVAGARALWSDAPAVIVGYDAAEAAEAAADRLPRRRNVAFLGRDLDSAAEWRRAVAVGAEHVVTLPDGEPWVVEFLADAATAVRLQGRTVAVIGGCGGAGATTLAIALAAAAARDGWQAMLIDADPYGGGIDLALSAEDVPGTRWPDLAETSGRLPAASLARALVRVDGMLILSWDRGDVVSLPPTAVDAVLAASRRSADLVVVDLARSFDAAAAVALGQADTTYLVVPAELRAVAAAARVGSQASKHCTDLRLIVRGPGEIQSPAAIAETVGLPLAGEIRSERAVARALDQGAPPTMGRGALARLCRDLVTDLLRRDTAAA